MRFASPEDWCKLHVVRLGVDPREYVPTPKPPGSGSFEIICVGRLAPVKAQLLLIEACALLAAKGRDVLLRLVGDGPSRRDLEAAATRLGVASRVVFHGALSHDRVLELYRAADLFALASFAEGIPVVLMEALALGLPCVATAIMGVPELIRDDHEGLLIAPSDTKALTEGIERLIDDPELRNRLAIAGRAKVLQDYDLQRNISQLAAYFSR
jgi:glycosyltransferase involved in cell wall biosynthesis